MQPQWILLLTVAWIFEVEMEELAVAKLVDEEILDLYRVNCSQKLEKLSTLCYFNETESAYKYCHFECKGGCTGGQNTDCLACKNFKLGQACVNQCPKTYTKDGLKTRPNKDGTYVLVMDCVKQCPGNMLIQGDDCVSACADGFYHDATENSRRCKDCPKNGCPKNCTVTENLTKDILADFLEGCTGITGFIAIRQDSGLTEADLAVLRNVTVITDYLHIKRTDFSNFSFLENLETIEGRHLEREKFALVVVDNYYLKELGLKKLKGITYGDVYIKRNRALCVFPTFNWTEWLVPKTSKVVIMDQMDKEQCKEENRGCHKECKGEGDCRGRGPANCFECKSWKENDSCVSNCSREGFYEEKETMQCRPCFEECLQCAGPNETDCNLCRNVAVQEDTRLICLKECGNRQYIQSRFCYPCHESCYEHGCSGPMDKLGQGGCNKCRYGLVDYNKVSRCLFTGGVEEKICLENNLTSYDFSPSNIEGTILGHCALPTMPLWKILVIISLAVLPIFGVFCMICYIRQKKRKEPRDIEEMPVEENSEESVGRMKMIPLNHGKSESYSVAVKMVNSSEEVVIISKEAPGRCSPDDQSTDDFPDPPAGKFYESNESLIQRTLRVSFDHLEKDVGSDEIELIEMQTDDEELGLGTKTNDSLRMRLNLSVGEKVVKSRGRRWLPEKKTGGQEFAG